VIDVADFARGSFEDFKKGVVAELQIVTKECPFVDKLKAFSHAECSRIKTLRGFEVFCVDADVCELFDYNNFI